MKVNKTKIINYALVFGALLIVLLVGFNGVEPAKLFDTLRHGIPGWVAACFLFYLLYMCTDASCIRTYLKQQGFTISFRYALFVSVEGLYYCGVTPGSAGGQPMQVYFLRKKGVPIGISSSALLVKQFSYQLVMIILDIILYLIYPDFVNSTLGGNRWILIVGFVYNSVIVGLLILVALNRSLVWKLLRLIIRIITKLHLISDPASTEAKWGSMLDSYHSSIQSFVHSPANVFKQLGLNMLQLLIYLSITCFAFRAFGQNTPGYMELMTMSTMLLTSANYTPLPGASGAQEGFFSLFFAPIVSETVRFPALLLWRFFTYYLALIVGAAASVIHSAKK